MVPSQRFEKKTGWDAAFGVSAFRKPIFIQYKMSTRARHRVHTNEDLWDHWKAPGYFRADLLRDDKSSRCVQHARLVKLAKKYPGRVFYCLPRFNTAEDLTAFSFANAVSDNSFFGSISSSHRRNDSEAHCITIAADTSTQSSHGLLHSGEPTEIPQNDPRSIDDQDPSEISELLREMKQSLDRAIFEDGDRPSRTAVSTDDGMGEVLGSISRSLDSLGAVAFVPSYERRAYG